MKIRGSPTWCVLRISRSLKATLLGSLCACSAIAFPTSQVPHLAGSRGGGGSPKPKAMHWMRGALGGLRGGGFTNLKTSPEAWAKREQLGQYSPYVQVRPTQKLDPRHAWSKLVH
jgi:hypothetical protein